MVKVNNKLKNFKNKKKVSEKKKQLRSKIRSYLMGSVTVLLIFFMGVVTFNDEKG